MPLPLRESNRNFEENFGGRFALVKRPRPFRDDHDAQPGLSATHQAESDSCLSHVLCAACRRAFRKFRLIYGSRFRYARTVETHKLHNSLRELDQSARRKCHFCTMIWPSLVIYVISPICWPYQSVPSLCN